MNRQSAERVKVALEEADGSPDTFMARQEALDILAAEVRALREELFVAQSVPLKTLAVCSEVDALVRAATAATGLALPDDIMHDLTLALEPFEAQS
jgi:hypothetical protein